MACFIVPTAEAIVTTTVTKILEKKGKTAQSEAILRVTDKLHWLNGLLWGGSALLAFEHVWHGEVQPFFPFLTAASDPASTAEMLHEMSTVGVGMAVLVTAVWVGMAAVSHVIEQRKTPALPLDEVKS